MDTTENKQYTVIEKKGKDLKYGDLVCIGGSQWESFDKDFEKSMKEFNDDEHVFLVRLPSSPPMEVKEQEAIIANLRNKLNPLWNLPQMLREMLPYISAGVNNYKLIKDEVANCMEAMPKILSILDKLQKPVISATDFLKENKYKLFPTSEYIDYPFKHCEKEVIKALTAYLQRQGQKTNQNKL